MSGFKDETLNIAFDSWAIDDIIPHLLRCSKKMKDDCSTNQKLLKNNEPEISKKLVAEYLNVKSNHFRYEIEIMENYNAKTGKHKGRVDIKVNTPDYFKNFNAHFIIQCKRIDGKHNLNKLYVAKGVSRFFLPIKNPKYPSYYGENIMFGYVVQDIDIPVNTDIIDKLQNALLKGVTPTGFVLNQSDNSNYYVYSCRYKTNSDTIKLYHLFYNFSNIIS